MRKTIIYTCSIIASSLLILSSCAEKSARVSPSPTPVPSYENMSENFARISDYYNRGLYYEAQDEVNWILKYSTISADDQITALEWKHLADNAVGNFRDVYKHFAKVKEYLAAEKYYEASAELTEAGKITLTPLEGEEWNDLKAQTDAGIAEWTERKAELDRKKQSSSSNNGPFDTGSLKKSSGLYSDSSSHSDTKSKSKVDDPFDASDYDDPEDFYYDNEDLFDYYEDAEDYYDDVHGE